MRNSTFWIRSVAIFAVATLAALAQTANAQATRTWVSGVGDDANPCSRTAPCKTFAGAISKTATGGEINALDNGAFGAVTIMKSITISADATMAGVLVSGTNGIIINAGATGVVVLRNIVFDGIASSGLTPGLSAVSVLAAGTVVLENLQISGFGTSGVMINTSADVNVMLDRVKIRNTTGPALTINASGGTARVVVDGLQVQNATTGISALTGASVDVANSSISFVTFQGISASTATSLVRLSNSTITANAIGLSTASGGQIISYNNNRLRGNTTDGAPTSTIYQR